MMVLSARWMQLVDSAFVVGLGSLMRPVLTVGLQADRFLVFLPTGQLGHSVCISCFVDVGASVLMGLPSQFPGNNWTIVPVFE